jgi:hypothetical protein
MKPPIALASPFAHAPKNVRILGSVALALIAGATMTLLARTWLLGFGIYQYALCYQTAMNAAILDQPNL